MNKEKNKNNSDAAFKRILSYVFKYKISVIMVFIFCIFESLISVISPKIAGRGITALSMMDSFGNPNIDLNYIFNLLAFLLVLYSVSGMLSCLGRYFFTNVSVKIVRDLRREISKKMNLVSFGYIQNKTKGDMISCVINDVETLSSSFIDSIRGIISSFILAVGTIYMMISISLEMSLCVFAVLPITIVVALVLVKKSQKYYESYREDLGNINTCIEESLSGYETLKSFRAEKIFIKDFDEINGRLFNASFESGFISGLMIPIMNFLSKFIYVVCCVLGGYLAVVRGLALGDITAFTVYSEQFIKPFMDLAGVFGNFQATFAAAKRVFEFLDAPEEVLDGKDAKNEFSSIEFKNVCFGYENSKDVIKDVSFKLGRGKTIAIVGETGGGKTTITKLLMRFYNASSGEILLNGENINSYDLNSYRKIFSIVTQDCWLYSGSIMENIRYGNFNASDEEVKNAAKLAGINDFINSLPEGYKTLIKEQTSNLSEGQKQLISIARAIISKSKILIMDEATASVDTVTESNIQKSLDFILKEKTSIIIAHRLSTIRNADEILVISDGELVERGNHSEIMSKKGKYFEMYKSSVV